MGQHQDGLVLRAYEFSDDISVGTQQIADRFRWLVADPEPDDLRRRAVKEGELAEVGILRGDHRPCVEGRRR